MNLIINGIIDATFSEFETRLEEMDRKDSMYFKLRELKINYCQGCWDCWVKTPGRCVLKDDHEQILSQIPSADQLTIITPILAGYESSLIKKFKDRLIPLIHPYIESYQGEQHHRQRYGKLPDIKVIVLEDEDTSDEDITILTELYERTSLNFRNKLIKIVRIKKGAEYEHVLTDI